MIRFLPLLALAVSAPALAQHQHDHSEPRPAAQADPHAGHKAPAAPAPAEQGTDPHAHHGASEAADAPAVAPPPAPALAGPAHAADAVYGPVAMEEARRGMRLEHGGMKASKIMLDRLEWRGRNGRDGYAWEADAWHGGDVDKAWLKSEGEGAFGEAPEKVEVQALWSRAIDPWFDLQLGLRHDFRPDPERTHLVLGVEGLAPYWFEVGAAAFLSDRGEVTARIEGEYDLRITQRLILQPAAEIDFSLQDVPALGLGSGVSTAEVGLRLRFEIEREFAPYFGIHYERAFAGTARYRRAAGEEPGGLSLVVGLRAWF